MDALHLKLVAGTLLVAGAFALLLPAMQRQIAIYQLKSAFPGLANAPSVPKGPRPWYAKVERVNTAFPGIAKVTVSVDNKSAAETLTSVAVQCVAIDPQGRALATGYGYVTNVAAGETGYGDAIIVMPEGTIYDNVKCKGEPTWQ